MLSRVIGGKEFFLNGLLFLSTCLELKTVVLNVLIWSREMMFQILAGLQLNITPFLILERFNLKPSELAMLRPRNVAN